MPTEAGIELSAQREIVTIRRLGGTSDSDWWRVHQFWGEFSTDEPKPDELRVPLSEFFFRKFWFRPNWIDRGLSLETADSLTQAVETVRKSEELFGQLTRTSYQEPSEHLIAQLAEVGLKRELTQAQLRNVASLLNSPHGANFSVPGAGKTATALAVFQILKLRGQIGRALIVCPKSAFEAWTSEPELAFEKPPVVEVFGGTITDPLTEILVVNFEALENDNRLRFLTSWLAQSDSMVVIDEAHRIKRGSSGRRWRACQRVASIAKRTDLLTGTPMPQSYEDLRNLLSVSWRVLPRNHLSDVGLSNLVPGGVFVRTTKGELELPKIRIEEVVIPMGPIQGQIYEAMSRMYSGTFSLSAQDQNTMRKKGRAVMTLLAAATNPALIRKDSKEELVEELQWPPSEITDSEDLINVLRSYLSHEIPAKYQWVAKYLEVASRQSRKTLVWSSFVGNLELLRDILSPYSPAVIHGGVDTQTRKEEIDRFRGDPDCHVLLTNPQTLGEGISLHTVAHEAVFIDRTYNAAQYLQALDRIHRLGLADDQDTTVYLLQSGKTVDQRVSVRLEQKISVLSEMLNDQGLKKVSIPQPDEYEGLVDTLGLDQIDLDDILAHLG